MSETKSVSTPSYLTDLDSHYIWYVSYGSNLSSERFSCYLAGGVPPGALREYKGCRDTTAPRQDKSVWLPGAVYFAGKFTVWAPGGGALFYDPTKPGPAAARARLITVRQFVDIVAQENGGEAGDFDHLITTVGGSHLNPAVHPVGDQGGELPRSLRVGDGSYGQMILLGIDEGCPAWTFTTHKHLPLNEPPHTYVEIMVAGLMESFGFSAEESWLYLSRCPGGPTGPATFPSA